MNLYQIMLSSLFLVYSIFNISLCTDSILVDRLLSTICLRMDILSHLSEKKYTVQYFKVWKEGFIESLIQNVMKNFMRHFSVNINSLRTIPRKNVHVFTSPSLIYDCTKLHKLKLLFWSIQNVFMNDQALTLYIASKTEIDFILE